MSIQRIKPCPKPWLVSVCFGPCLFSHCHRSSRPQQPSYSPVFDGRTAQSECHRVRLHRFSFGCSASVLRHFRDNGAMIMRLYQHSAHCPVAMRTFLDGNPMYWCFIPIPRDQSPTTDVPDPTKDRQPLRTVDRAQVMRCLRHVPGPPTAHFFSQRQRKMQHSFFDYFLSLDHEQQRPYQALDLFQVNIIVVRKCSRSYSPEQSDFTASLHSSARRSFDRATLCHRDDVCHSRRNEIEHDLSDRWRSKEMLWPPLSTALVHRSLQSSRLGHGNSGQHFVMKCHEECLLHFSLFL